MNKFLGVSNHGDPYAMKVLRDECASLRKKVKDLEDDHEGSGSEVTCKTVDSADSADHMEMTSLRKELNKVENEKASMELDFMNQLSQISRDSSEKIEVVRKLLELTQSELRNKNKSNAPPQDNSVVKQLKEDLKATDKELNVIDDSVIEQLKEDLSAADKELKVNRRDVENLYKKVEKLEAQKSALIDEVTSSKLEVDIESKAISSLNDAMAENDKHFQSRIAKLEAEVAQKNTVINKQQEEMGGMNDKMIRSEGQKAMLLEEITDLRMQLDRNDDSKKVMKKKLDELHKANSGEEESSRVGSLKQAASDAEEKADELQAKMESFENELRSVTKSYKADALRLEETVALKEMECEQAHKMLHEKDLEVKKVKTEHKEADDAAKDFKVMLDEGKKTSADLERELSSLANEHVSYEKKTTQSITEYLVEADNANTKFVAFEKQVKILERQVGIEKEINVKLRARISDSKNKPLPIQTSKKVPAAPPRTPPRPPMPSYIKRVPESQSNLNTIAPNSPASASAPGSPAKRNVRALAARFESSKTTKKTDAAPSSSVEPVGPDFENIQRQVTDLEMQLDDAKDQNEVLHQKLQEQCEQIGELHAEVATFTATRSAIQSSSRREFEKESQEAQAKIEQLESDLVEARKQLEVESNMVEKLQTEIGQMTSERLAYEECTMDAYEKRSVKSQKIYQGELNNLKVELTKAQMKLASIEKENEKQVKELELTILDLNTECDKELEEQHGEADMFKHKYEEQVDMVEKLEREREQLCDQMKSISCGRRDEIDELQADVMQRTTEVASLKRALQAIQMEVEHNTDNKEEMEFLRDKIYELESQRGPTGTEKHKLTYQVEKLQSDNQKLKDQVRNITMERRGLQEKMHAALSDKTKDRSTPQVLRERNEKLRREVARLARKLEHVDGGVQRIAI